MDNEVKEKIIEAVAVLKQGGVIAIPTETVYGLACDPKNPKAVKKIFAIKGRKEDKPLQLIASSMTQVNPLVILNPHESKAVKKYWPGPLTLLLRLKSGVKLAPHVSPNQTIGIRVTSSTIAQAVAKGLGHPIAATSANRSGSSPAVSGLGVARAFKNYENKPDFILDIGAIPKNLPTTVASIAENGEATVYRRRNQPMNKNEIIATLKKLGKRPSKGLGQNFLIDKNILSKIVDSAEIKKGDRILEIGPGLGVLTSELVNNGAAVTFIEKDKVLAERLDKQLPLAKGARGICADASKISFDDLMGKKPWKFVSNLPYAITSISLRKALYASNPPILLVALIQKEVADRILAKDKKQRMSLLALMSHLACSDIKIIHKVSPTSFYPPPKVDSAIIKMVPMSPELRLSKWGIDPETVMKIAKLGFAHPRKFLSRNLNIKAEQWSALAQKLNLNEKARAEDLSADEWVELAKLNSIPNFYS